MVAEDHVGIVCPSPDGPITWDKTGPMTDSASDDYIHRPTHPMFDQMCSYKFAMHFKKILKTQRKAPVQNNKPNGDIERSDDNNDCSDSDVGASNEKCDDDDSCENIHELGSDNEDDERDGCGENDDEDYDDFFEGPHYDKKKYSFANSHPGQKFSHVAVLKKMVIPKVFLPKGKLCNVEDLDLQNKHPCEFTQQKREDYSKQALLMFYPHRKLADIMLDESHWKLFFRELELYRSDQPTVFWKKGFQILQNIQDRDTMEKKLKRVKDPIAQETVCKQPDECENKTKTRDASDQLPDILDFCSTQQ